MSALPLSSGRRGPAAEGACPQGGGSAGRRVGGSAEYREGRELDAFVYGALEVMATGVPLVLVIVAAAFLILTPRLPEGGNGATAPLRIAGLLCAGVWILLYSEDGSRRPFIDIAAPIASLIALPALPLLALLIWRQRRVLARLPRARARLVVACALMLFSLGPGAFLIIFYAGMLCGR